MACMKVYDEPTGWTAIEFDSDRVPLGLDAMGPRAALERARHGELGRVRATGRKIAPGIFRFHSEGPGPKWTFTVRFTGADRNWTPSQEYVAGMIARYVNTLDREDSYSLWLNWNPNGHSWSFQKKYEHDDPTPWRSPSARVFRGEGSLALQIGWRKTALRLSRRPLPA